MDGAAIQAKVNYGYKKAAQYLGLPYSHYRPLSASVAALDSSNLLDTLKLTFSQGGNYEKPSATNKAEYVGYYDVATVQVGDYLSNGPRTFFVIAQQPILLCVLVNCDRVFTFSRPFGQTGFGQVGYGGSTPTTETPLMAGRPGSCQQGTKGEKGDVTLPGDVRDPWWNIRIPAFGGVILQTDDIITDDIGRRYSISSAELSEYGWRLTCRQNQV